MVARNDDPEVTRWKRRFIWSNFITFMTISALIGSGVWYIHKQEQKICGLIVTLDRIYQGTPPTTPTGREMAKQVHSYRVSIDCK